MANNAESLKKEYEISMKMINTLQIEIDFHSNILKSLKEKQAIAFKLNRELKIKNELLLSAENKINKSPSQFSYIVTNIHPLIPKEQIKDYFARLFSDNVVKKVKLIVNEDESVSVESISAVVVFRDKLDSKKLAQCLFMRGKQISIQPIEDENDEISSSDEDVSENSSNKLAPTKSTNRPLYHDASIPPACPTRTIRVAETKLPFTSDKELFEYFKKFGKITRFCTGKKLKWIIDYRYFFVQFINTPCVDEVMKIKDHRINDTILQVKLWRDW